MDARPLLAVTVGDPAGIGPEVTFAALGDPAVRAAARAIVLGPASLRPASCPEPGGLGGLGARAAQDAGSFANVEDLAWLSTSEHERFELGRATERAGRAALAALRRGVELALANEVDGLVTAPVS